MDFGLNEQQIMLQKSAREFLTTEYSDKILKEMAKDPKGYTPELWNKMAELGWMALSIPEAYGGIGDFIDLTVVLQEMGRAGLISPFFSSVVLGASAIIALGNEEQKQKYLSAIAEGKKIFTLALLETSARYTPEAVQLEAKAGGNGYLLKGQKLFVPDANSADYMIVAARTGKTSNPADGISLFVVEAKAPGVTCNLLDTFSPDKQSEVVFQDVSVSREDVLGEVDRAWPALEKVLEKAAIATCAKMVGGMDNVLDFTVAYAKDRNAFGHPIGAFQAVQHRCADMLIDKDSSRLITYQAAWRINEGLPAAREVAIAKAWVGKAYRRIVTSSHQVHGGIGFTYDHILHWYTKRAREQEFSYGDVDYHLDRLVELTKTGK
jgi:alkylation response protein AidB-like acyl-CoA dehydrogenase